jgi:hypothetical protein
VIEFGRFSEKLITCIAKLPLVLRRALGGGLAAGYYLFDYREIRSVHSGIIARARLGGIDLPSVTTFHATRSLVLFLVESAFIRAGDTTKLAAFLKSNTRFRNASDLCAYAGVEPGDQKGVIFVSSNFACFYYTYLTSWPTELKHREIVIVQPEKSLKTDRDTGFSDKLRILIGQKVSTIASGTPSAGMQVVRALQRGALVACLVDFLPPETGSVAVTELLGNQSCQSTVLATIAIITRSVIVPVYTVYENGNFVTHFDPPIVPDGGLTRDEAVCEICANMDQSISSMVREHSNQWVGWQGAEQRWEFADQMLRQMDPISE